MTIREAYDEVVKEIANLEKDGLTVHKCSRADSEIESGKEDCLARSLWMNVGIEIPDDGFDRIFAAEERLYQKGISFDTGAGFGVRDWEIDWSLSCKG